MSESATIDFRAVCADLYCACVEQHTLDLKEQRLALTALLTDGGRQSRLALVFEGVTRFRWHSDSPEPCEQMELSVVGLERLAAGDVWRLYLNPYDSAELELSCRRITCNGAEVTGVGRCFQDELPTRDGTEAPSA